MCQGIVQGLASSIHDIINFICTNQSPVQLCFHFSSHRRNCASLRCFNLHLIIMLQVFFAQPKLPGIPPRGVEVWGAVGGLQPPNIQMFCIATIYTSPIQPPPPPNNYDPHDHMPL